MRSNGIIKMLRGLFITSMFLLPANSLEAQLIHVESELSSDSMMIGEQLTYTLRVDAESELKFILPSISDTLSSSLEVISAYSSDTTVSEGRTLIEHSYLITGFDAGSQIVPSQEVIYMRGDDVDTARSMPLIINVYDPPVDTAQQIKPIKPPINTPLSFREVLPWAIIAFGGLLLLGLLVWTIRSYLLRKKDPDAKFQKPLEPAHVLAFRELDKLKEQKIWAKGEVKEYYTRLTEITRNYIERQYDIPAMESTSEEILHAFRRANKEDQLLDEILSDLLELADLVKFAREDPLPVDNQTNLNNAYIFVQKTYPLFMSVEEKTEAADE